jgi:4-hydroxy-3-polyprenylbenzoate decarboxylase
MDNQSTRRVTLAITGASGMPYALRLLEQLLVSKCTVYLLISRPAKVVIATETDYKLPSNNQEISDYLLKKMNQSEGDLQVFGMDEWFSPVASGSNAADAMVVCPCSMSTLSAIAIGASNTLLERAADVMIKEQRKLILVPRETPLSAIHLQHMLTLAQIGVTILPAAPAFYHQPDSIIDLIDFIVARLLDHLGVEHQLIERWNE